MPLNPKARFEIVADDKTKRGVDSADGNLARLRKQISLTGVASIAAAGVAGLGALTVAGFRMADELDETSSKLGLTTEALAGMRHAARLTGVATTKLDLGLQRMTRRVAEAAQGTGEAQDALKELGLDAEHLNQLSPDEQFKEIAAAMAGVTNQADRVRLGFKLFDSEGVDLIRTLELGADGLDRAAREADKFGTAISRVEAEQIGLAGEQVDRLKTATEGLATQLAVRFSPAIAEGAENLADWIAFITNTAIPAFALMAERIGLVELNVRALSEQELLVRTVSLSDKIADIQQQLKDLPKDATKIKFGLLVPETERLNADLAEAKRQLQEVEDRLAFLRSGAGEPISPIVVTSNRDDFDRRLEAMRQEAEQRQKIAEAQAAREAETAARAAQQEAERRAQELEGVRNFLKTREELEIEAFERRNQIIIENMAAGEERDALLLENARKRAQFLIELERFKQEEINRAVEQGTHTREEFEKASTKSQARSVFGTLESITAGVATHSKRMFQLNKAAAIANAVMNTAEGVTKALSAYPPPISFVMAAAQAAAGAVQISAIRSAQFGGGSTPSVVGSTPTLAGQPVPTPGTPATGAQSAGNGNVVEVHFHGSGFLGTEDIKRVMQDQFDADEVIIHRNTRQAAEIRG